MNETEVQSGEQVESQKAWRKQLEGWRNKLADTRVAKAFKEMTTHLRQKLGRGEARQVIEDIAELDVQQDSEFTKELPKLEENPHEENEEVELVEQQTLHLLRPGDTFQDAMPILSGDEERAYYEQLDVLYGENEIGRGKWSVVREQGSNANKIYLQPDSLKSAYDAVFWQKFGGKAGLPQFRGFIPNGVSMELIVGDTLNKLLIQKKIDQGITENDVAIEGLVSQEQAQELLDRVAEYHQVTQRVHGDLSTSKFLENIMVDEEGHVRILDTEWERIGTQTPQSEIDGLYTMLTENMGIDGLVKPKTISDEAAAEGLASLKEEVLDMVERDEVFGYVKKFKGDNRRLVILKKDEKVTKSKDIPSEPQPTSPAAPVLPTRA